MTFKKYQLQIIHGGYAVAELRATITVDNQNYQLKVILSDTKGDGWAIAHYYFRYYTYLIGIYTTNSWVRQRLEYWQEEAARTGYLEIKRDGVVIADGTGAVNVTRNGEAIIQNQVVDYQSPAQLVSQEYLIELTPGDYTFRSTGNDYRERQFTIVDAITDEVYLRGGGQNEFALRLPEDRSEFKHLTQPELDLSVAPYNGINLANFNYCIFLMKESYINSEDEIVLGNMNNYAFMVLVETVVGQGNSISLPANPYGEENPRSFLRNAVIVKEEHRGETIREMRRLTDHNGHVLMNPEDDVGLNINSILHITADQGDEANPAIVNLIVRIDEDKNIVKFEHSNADETITLEDTLSYYDNGPNDVLRYCQSFNNQDELQFELSSSVVTLETGDEKQRVPIVRLNYDDQLQKFSNLSDEHQS